MIAFLLASTLAFPLPCSYQANSSQGAPLISDGRIDTAAVMDRARWPRLVLDISPFGNTRGTAWPQVPGLIRRFNPRAQVLGYVQTNSVWFTPGSPPAPSFNQDFYNCLMRFNAWLYAPNGKLRSDWNVNWGNKAFADSITKLLLHQNALRIWDGLFLDSWCQSIDWTVGPTSPIDYARAGFANIQQMDSARVVNMSAVVSKLKAAGVKVWTNSGLEPIPHTDGDLREGFDTGGLTPATQAVAWMCTPGNHWLKAESYGGPYSAENCRLARFALGVSCLGTDGSGASQGPERGAAGWYDEYSVDASGRSNNTGANTGWLGGGLDTTQVSPGVWLRWFDNGAVIVNTTSSAQIVWTWIQMSRIRGTIDPLINSGQPGTYFYVPARDALFLKRAPVADVPGPGVLPPRFLARAIPNPVRGEGAIEYTLPADAVVTVRLFDPSGRVVATLLDGAKQPAGEHRVAWRDGRLAPGQYFYRVRAGALEAEGRLVVLH